MSTVTTAEVFAMGRAAAADWLRDNHTHAKPISLAKCRAVRLTDMVLQYEALPQFDELLASWEAGFDSAARQDQAATSAERLVKTAETVAGAAHVPFSFLHDSLKHEQSAQFVEMTMSMAQGLELCLELVNSSTLTTVMNGDADADDQESPVLSYYDTERLTRFAIASAGLLARHAESRIEWLNKHCAKEGK